MASAATKEPGHSSHFEATCRPPPTKRSNASKRYGSCSTVSRGCPQHPVRDPERSDGRLVREPDSCRWFFAERTPGHLDTLNIRHEPLQSNIMWSVCGLAAWFA